MVKGIEAVLDECLACLETGGNLEACLRKYPQWRGELEPLLRTALALRRAYVRPANAPAALSRVRTRFLAEAQRRQRALADAPRNHWLSWRPHLSFSSGIATALVVIVLLGGLLAGGSIVSANSLPGDALYSVKRASEQVRLLLTFDAEQRADLAQKYDDLRVAEVRKVVEQRRVVEVRFAGAIEGMNGDVIVIHGIPLRLSAVPPQSGPLSVGTEVQVVARANDDGSLEVKSLAVREQPGAAVVTKVPTPTEMATTPIEERPTSAPTTEKPAASVTPTDSPTATSSPTETAMATETPAPTDTPTVTPSPTRTATPTKKPMATLVPPPQGVKVRIEGRIDEVAADHWMVAGQRVLLHVTTRFNLTRASAQVGGWAVVDALKSPDGSLTAIEIVVMRGSEQPPVVKEFSGIIESIAEGRWTVAGHTVIIAADTVIEGTPRVGLLAHVKAEQRSDGSLVARRIVVEAEQVVQFAGIITSIGADRWVIGGQEVLVDAGTTIEGQPVVGAMAQVEAVVRADGTTRARRIKVEPLPPTAAPTSTATPAAQTKSGPMQRG